MNILAVSHPIPTKYAERIYNERKNVFVGKSYLGKASVGDKFIIYESHGARAYTGWADIKSIGKQKTSIIARKYGKNLIITKDELQEYANGKSEMNVIEFENFEKFKNPVKPSSCLSTTTVMLCASCAACVRILRGSENIRPLTWPARASRTSPIFSNMPSRLTSSRKKWLSSLI
jgi:hypothetical protein